jgi:hypothetical protein
VVTDFLLKLGLGLVSGILSFFPNLSLDPSGKFPQYGSSIGQFIGELNGYVPEYLGLFCFGLLYTLRISKTALRAVIFVYKLLPFKAT